jgi:hypothetical protein
MRLTDKEMRMGEKDRAYGILINISEGERPVRKIFINLCINSKSNSQKNDVKLFSLLMCLMILKIMYF